MAPLTATTGLPDPSKVSAVVPHRVRLTSARLESTRTRSRLVSSLEVRWLTMVAASWATLHTPEEKGF